MQMHTFSTLFMYQYKTFFSVMYWVKLLLNFLPLFWNDTIKEISVKTFPSCFDTNMLNLWTHGNIFLSYHFKRWKCKSYLFTTSQTKYCSNGNKNNVISTLFVVQKILQTLLKHRKYIDHLKIIWHRERKLCLLCM